MKPKNPKTVAQEPQPNLIWLNASLFNPRITKDGRTLMLFLGKGNVVVGLNLAYLDAIRSNSKKRSA